MHDTITHNSPSQDIKTANRRNIFSTIVVLTALVAVGMVGHSFGKLSVETDSTQADVSTPSELETSAAPYYQNSAYGFRFSVNDIERVVECPNNNESNENVAMWIVNTPLPDKTDPQLECATEGSFDTLFASKKSQAPRSVEETIAVYESADYGYKLTKTPVTISGVDGVRITGSRDPRVAAPLPDSLDKLLFEKNGVSYQIPADYLERDFSFIVE